MVKEMGVISFFPFAIEGAIKKMVWFTLMTTEAYPCSAARVWPLTPPYALVVDAPPMPARPCSSIRRATSSPAAPIMPHQFPPPRAGQPRTARFPPPQARAMALPHFLHPSFSISTTPASSRTLVVVVVAWGGVVAVVPVCCRGWVGGAGAGGGEGRRR